MPDFPRSNPPLIGIRKCCAAWHFRSHPIALLVYDLVGLLTNGGERGRVFYSTSKEVAVYYGKDESQIRKVFSWLNETGWVVVLPGQLREKKKKRRYVPHAEWAANHEAQCYVKQHAMPWEGEADPLFNALTAAFHGELRIFPHMLSEIRKRCADEMVLAHLAKRWEESQARIAGGDRSGPRGAGSVFWAAIKELPPIDRAFRLKEKA